MPGQVDVKRFPITSFILISATEIALTWRASNTAGLEALTLVSDQAGEGRHQTGS